MTTFKVMEFQPKTLKPNQDVIERLEWLLGHAKAGKLVGIAGAWVDEKYEVAYFHSARRVLHRHYVPRGSWHTTNGRDTTA